MSAERQFLRGFHSGGSIPTPIEEIGEIKCGLDIIPLPGLRDLLDVVAGRYLGQNVTIVRPPGKILRHLSSLLHPHQIRGKPTYRQTELW
jgi:hypothetical protein